MEDLSKKYAYLKNRTLGVRIITYIQILLILVIITITAYNVNIIIHEGIISIVKIFSSALLFMTGVVTIVRGYSKKEREYYVSGTLFLIASFVLATLALTMNSTFNDLIFDRSFNSPPIAATYIPIFIVVLAVLCIIIIDLIEDKKKKMLNLLKSILITFYLIIGNLVVYLTFTYVSQWVQVKLNMQDIFLMVIIVFMLISLFLLIKSTRWRHDSYYHLTVMALLLFLFQGVFYYLADGDLTDSRTLLAEIFFQVGILLVAFAHFIRIYELLNKGDLQKDLAIQQSHRLEMFNRATDNVSDMIVISDPDGIVLYANPAVSKITGYSFAEVMGSKAGTLWGQQMPTSYFENMWDTIKNRKTTFNDEIKNKRKSGISYYAHLNISPVLNHEKEVMYFVAIERDITEEKISATRKYNFLSVISHRLRTPLTTSKWSLEMLANGDAGKITKDQAQLITDLNNANERLIELVNLMTRITDLEAGHIIINIESLALKDCIKEVVKNQKEVIDNKNIEIKLASPLRIPEVEQDKDLVEIIIEHILSNAVKFSPDKSEINISLKSKDGYIIVAVKDEGPGIPKEDQNHVFTTFYRGNNIVARDVQGTGMGLYMTKLLMDIIGGKVWFESSEGSGSTFWLAFPIASKIKIKKDLSDDVNKSSVQTVDAVKVSEESGIVGADKRSEKVKSVKESKEDDSEKADKVTDLSRAYAKIVIDQSTVDKKSIIDISAQSNMEKALEVAKKVNNEKKKRLVKEIKALKAEIKGSKDVKKIKKAKQVKKKALKAKRLGRKGKIKANEKE